MTTHQSIPRPQLIQIFHPPTALPVLHQQEDDIGEPLGIEEEKLVDVTIRIELRKDAIGWIQ